MSDPISQNKHHLLDRIINALEIDRCLSHTVLAYIDTTLFPPDPQRLAAFLTDDRDSERDSLLDLIFYPGQAVQIELEPLLGAARFSVDDEKDVHVRLMARGIDARIGMPDGRHLVSIPVPDFIKSQYLERLKISWHVDRDVDTAISGEVSTSLRTIVRVRLRNAGIQVATKQRVFLCRFFERMADDDTNFLACLDLVLAIMGDKEVSADGYDLLVEHKRRLFRSLQQAKRFEAALHQSNMETLMLQGVRAPNVSTSELGHQMRLIDQICFGVFGKTETIDMPLEKPLREVSDFENPAAAVHSLLP